MWFDSSRLRGFNSSAVTNVWFESPGYFEHLHGSSELLRLTQRWVSVHPVTHEGQLLTLARLLGLGHPLPEDMGLDLIGPFEL